MGHELGDIKKQRVQRRGSGKKKTRENTVNTWGDVTLLESTTKLSLVQLKDKIHTRKKSTVADHGRRENHTVNGHTMTD